MLQLFRNYQIPTVLLVLLYLLVLSTNLWLYPHSLLSTVDDLPSTLGQWLMSWLTNSGTNRIFFTLIVWVQALVLNGLVNQFRLAKHTTFIPAILFILMHFTGPELDICSPVVFANGFLIWCLHQLWRSGEKRVPLGVIFNIGFTAAMAALCYHGFFVLLFWVMLAWVVVRSFDPQEFILLLGGFGVPFFLMGTYHFVNDNLGNWWSQELGVHYRELQVYYTQEATWPITVGLLAIGALIVLVQWSSIQFKTTTREKQAIQATLLLALVLGFSFLVQAQLYSYHFVVFAVPFGILLSLALQSMKSYAMAEMLHLLLFLGIIGLQYHRFFFQ